MCTICTAFRPFDPECSYEAFGPQTVPFSNPTFAREYRHQQRDVGGGYVFGGPASPGR